MATNSQEPTGNVAPPQAGRIHLRILSPGQGVAETIDIRDVPLEISVGQLKERIVVVAPSHPPAAHQRLIFAGRLLSNDNAKLSEALDPACRNSESLTIHMIARDTTGLTRSQPVTRAATPGQTAQPIPPAQAVPTAEPHNRQEQAVVPPGQNGQQLPQLPQQVPGLPPNQGLPGMPNPFPFGMPSGAQFHFQQGMAHPHNLQHPQSAQAQTGQGTPGATQQPSQNGQPMPLNPHEQMMAMMQEMARQQHDAVHRAHVEATSRRGQHPQANQLAQGPITQTFHAHWNPREGLHMHQGQSGEQPPSGSQDAGNAASQTQDTARSTNQQPQVRSQTAPLGQQNVPQQSLRQQSSFTNGLQEQTGRSQAQAPPVQDQPQRSQSQPAHRHPQPVLPGQMRLPTGFQPRPFAPQVPRPPIGMVPMALPGMIPPAQHLAASFANIQAQAQLMAAPQTLYLLSSPTGPQALLYHNGQPYSAQLPRSSRPSSSPPANQANNPNRQNAQQPPPLNNAVDLPFPLVPQPANAVAPQAAADAIAPQADAPAVQGGQDVLAPLQPLLQHFWLLFRVLLFAYFFIGTDDGYRRPLILAGIAMAFFGLRALDGDGGVRRRVQGWWEGVVGVGPRGQQGGGVGAQAVQHQGQGQGQDVLGQLAAEGRARLERPGQGAAGEAVGAEGVAAQGQGEAEDAHLSPLRRRLRPVERAAALFVASLWPGVGENTVRARREREAEERRAREEREREEQARLEGAQRDETSEGSGGNGEEGAVEGYPRNVPINVEGPAGATGVEGVDSIAELERRRRREAGEEE
ncbi:Hypothetical protein D9617_7g032410 [Elsinoe fawcettii]|nr:Hypothetical protein D9617_7g032410 [Elsinoe fawcettii]